MLPQRIIAELPGKVLMQSIWDREMAAATGAIMSFNHWRAEHIFKKNSFLYLSFLSSEMAKVVKMAKVVRLIRRWRQPCLSAAFDSGLVAQRAKSSWGMVLTMFYPNTLVSDQGGLSLRIAIPGPI